jgi:Flp pilus assembly pilin Flp
VVAVLPPLVATAIFLGTDTMARHDNGRGRTERDDMNLIKTYLPYMRAWLRRDSGQDLMEYALLVALISLVAVAILSQAGGAVQTIFARITGDLQSAGAGGTP